MYSSLRWCLVLSLLNFLQVLRCQRDEIGNETDDTKGLTSAAEAILTQEQVTSAIEKAVEILQKNEKEIKGVLNLDNLDIVLVYGKPRQFRKFRLGFIVFISGEILKKSLFGRLNKYDFAEYLNSFSVKGTILELECPFTETVFQGRICDPKYREIDGFCNNLKNPIWGSSHSPSRRFLPPDYGDGLSEPRLTIEGKPLSNARLISTTALMTKVIEDPKWTNTLMSWGQFMDHEFALTSSPSGDKFGGIICCGKNKNNPICFPIAIPEDDYFYSKYNQRCMENVRSAPVVPRDCRLGARQHKNEVTSYIDASTVYGSIASVRDSLRLFNKGLLKTQPNPKHSHRKPLLPKESLFSGVECANKTQEFKCFLAGDERANQNAFLLSYHHIFLREHNRIVIELSKLNPHWNDEKLFQEGRRIIAAMMQHITYKGYLPIILGSRALKKYRLELEDTGYFTGYDDKLDASAEQGFAVAAYRFGHSQIAAHIFRVTEDRQKYSPLKLRQNFFMPEHIYNDQYPKGLEPVVRGLTQQHSFAMDSNFAEDVKNHLFENPAFPFGLDLPAINIMRGRDHGIPGYNEWREFCGYKRFETFAAMEEHMFPGSPANLAKVYKHPDDVDFFAGGVNELPIGGGVAPPTMACIIGIQFHNLRYGDRFWYENFPKPGLIDYPFQPNQLQEIRKISLSKLACTNTDDIRYIQKNMFMQPGLQYPRYQFKPLEGGIEYSCLKGIQMIWNLIMILSQQLSFLGVGVRTALAHYGYYGHRHYHHYRHRRYSDDYNGYPDYDDYSNYHG